MNESANLLWVYLAFLKTESLKLADSFIIVLSTGKDLPYSLYKSRLQFTPYPLMGLL